MFQCIKFYVAFLLQVTLERFTLGKFTSFLTDGCPDGWLTLEEQARPSVGGLWCGTSWGPVLYYSETPILTLSITLLTLSSDQNGYNFDFRISYKMLHKKDATVRYGRLLSNGKQQHVTLLVYFNTFVIFFFFS